MALSTLPQQEALGRIKADLGAFVGKKVRMRTTKGRGVTWEREGTLENIYPNLFIIQVVEGKVLRRVSYSYADVLTKTIKLCCAQTGEDIFPWLPDRF